MNLQRRIAAGRTLALSLARYWVPALLGLIGCAWLAFVFTQLDRTPIVNSEGYLKLADRSLWSAEFYLSARPFTVPLMYKIFGDSKPEVVTGQLLFSTFAWLFLCGTLAHLIKSRALRLLHCLVFPALMVWWNIMGWNFVMRSESTTFSFLALWVASLVLYFQRPSAWRVGFVCAMTLLFCNTRDSVPLVVVPATVAVLAGEYANRRRSKRHRRYAWVLAAAALFTFALQSYTSQHVLNDEVKTRHEFPFANVMMQRILPDPARASWFEQNGMPIHSELLRWKKRWASGNRWALFRDARYAPLMTWIRSEARTTYARYLLTHPDYVIDTSLRAGPDLFPTTLEYYTHAPPPRLVFTWSGLALPLVGPSLAALLALAGLVRSCLRPSRALLSIASLMVLLVLIHAVLVVLMDAMEVPRHEVVNVPWLQLAVYTGFLAWVGGQPARVWRLPALVRSIRSIRWRRGWERLRGAARARTAA